MAGNYFVTGPDTKGGTLSGPTAAYHLYATGNYYDPDRNGKLDGRALDHGDFGTVTWEAAPTWDFPKVEESTAQEAYASIVSMAGANRWRDAVDSLLLRQLASLGKEGAQIASETELGLPDGVGRVPGGQAALDSDRDGMPDAWEAMHGLDPRNPLDRNATGLSAEGYTNLEVYLDELAGDPVVYKSSPIRWHGPAGTGHAAEPIAWFDPMGRLLKRAGQDGDRGNPRPWPSAGTAGAGFIRVALPGSARSLPRTEPGSAP
jgi:hypothetical protein